MTQDRSFKQLYFFLFAPFALHVTYLTLFYRRRGFDDFQIGLLEAVGSVCVIVSPFIWGPLGDRIRRKRLLVAGLALAMSLLFPLLWFAPPLLAFLVPVAAGLYLSRAPLIPLIDATFLDTLAARGDRAGNSYGRVRLWGSIGFIVAATALPPLLPEGGDPLQRLKPVFFGFLVFALLLALRAATLADPPVHPHDEAEPLERGRIGAVLALPQYKRLLVLLLVSWISNQTYYLFLSIYLDNIGVPDSGKGVYWSMGVLAEVCLMAAGPTLLRRYGVKALLMAGFIGRAVRVFAFCVPQDPWVVLFVFQPLHALGFAAVHIATMAYLARTVPARLRATGQTLNAGLVAGFGGVIGSPLAGWISETSKTGHYAAFAGLQGVNAAYFIAGLIQLVVIVVAWYWLKEPPAGSGGE